ncbi:hypothetical protein O181_002794 [Austropuccinia psidii MF-1]|uniref:Uncharacterized protein n=1 Tax=Austropuccinia psidii MF-1 TaxID=1389203 RepID=A0A9Q3BCY2_9BASI|nr:hypothetical protein [Austropuccinia psidii MF-1]
MQATNSVINAGNQFKTDADQSARLTNNLEPGNGPQRTIDTPVASTQSSRGGRSDAENHICNEAGRWPWPNTFNTMPQESRSASPQGWAQASTFGPQNRPLIERASSVASTSNSHVPLVEGTFYQPYPHEALGYMGDPSLGHSSTFQQPPPVFHSPMHPTWADGYDMGAAQDYEVNPADWWANPHQAHLQGRVPFVPPGHAVLQITQPAIQTAIVPTLRPIVALVPDFSTVYQPVTLRREELIPLSQIPHPQPMGLFDTTQSAQTFQHAPPTNFLHGSTGLRPTPPAGQRNSCSVGMQTSSTQSQLKKSLAVEASEAQRAKDVVTRPEVPRPYKTSEKLSEKVARPKRYPQEIAGLSPMTMSAAKDPIGSEKARGVAETSSAQASDGKAYPDTRLLESKPVLSSKPLNSNPSLNQNVVQSSPQKERQKEIELGKSSMYLPAEGKKEEPSLVKGLTPVATSITKDLPTKEASTAVSKSLSSSVSYAKVVSGGYTIQKGPEISRKVPVHTPFLNENVPQASREGKLKNAYSKQPQILGREANVFFEEKSKTQNKFKAQFDSVNKNKKRVSIAETPLDERFRASSQAQTQSRYNERKQDLYKTTTIMINKNRGKNFITPSDSVDDKFLLKPHIYSAEKDRNSHQKLLRFTTNPEKVDTSTQIAVPERSDSFSSSKPAQPPRIETYKLALSKPTDEKTMMEMNRVFEKSEKVPTILRNENKLNNLITSSDAVDNSLVLKTNINTAEIDNFSQKTPSVVSNHQEKVDPSTQTEIPEKGENPTFSKGAKPLRIEQSTNALSRPTDEQTAIETSFDLLEKDMPNQESSYHKHIEENEQTSDQERINTLQKTSENTTKDFEALLSKITDSYTSETSGVKLNSYSKTADALGSTPQNPRLKDLKTYAKLIDNIKSLFDIPAKQSNLKFEILRDREILIPRFINVFQPWLEGQNKWKIYPGIERPPKPWKLDDLNREKKYEIMNYMGDDWRGRALQEWKAVGVTDFHLAGKIAIHLKLLGTEKYLAHIPLESMSSELYKVLREAWESDWRDMIKLQYWARRYLGEIEGSRRLWALSCQILRHTVVENWRVIKEHLIAKKELKLPVADELEKAFQLASLSPDLVEMSRSFSSLAIFEQPASSKEALEGFLDIVLGPMDMNRRLRLGKCITNYKLIESWWESLTKAADQNGLIICRVIEVIRALHLDFPEDANFLLDQDLNTSNVRTLASNLLDLQTSFVYWYESIERAWLVRQFGEQYRRQFERLCKRPINQAKIFQSNPVKLEVTYAQLSLSQIAVPLGDILLLHDSGFAPPTIKALYYALRTEDMREFTQWETLFAKVRQELTEEQKSIFQSVFTSPHPDNIWIS